MQQFYHAYLINTTWEGRFLLKGNYFLKNLLIGCLRVNRCYAIVHRYMDRLGIAQCMHKSILREERILFVCDFKLHLK